MKGLIPKTQMFLKRHSPTILTCIGAVGVVATAVTAVRATPKAMDLLKASEAEKGEKLTTLETIKIAGPAYIPSALIGASTIACIFGANSLNKKQQASIASAYALLDTTYKEYRGKVKEIYGDDGDRKVMEKIAEDKPKDVLPVAEDDSQLFFDSRSLRWFRSTLETVQQAEDYISNVYNKRGYVTLGEFYDALDVAAYTTDYRVGWMADPDYHDIRFNYHEVADDDGRAYIIIEMPFEPEFNYYFL